MPQAPRVVLLMFPYAGYDRGLLRGIARYAQFRGPWVCYLSGDQPDLPLPEIEGFGGGLLPVRRVAGGGRGQALPELRRLGASGFIGRIQTPAVAKAVLEARLPAIAMDLSEAQAARGSPLARLSEVVPDSAKAGRLAAEHFLERGFRHFAFCGHPARIWSRRREEGFCRRLEEAGFAAACYQPGGRKALAPGRDEPARLTAWLQSLAKPVGVMACNDALGRRIIEASAAGAMLVPDEVSVIGVDEDRLLCELSNPSLSSVALDSQQAGYRAAELLDRMMAGERLPRQTIWVDPLWVVARRSTEVIAVEDRDVAEGLRFIREHARRPIGVADVVRHSAVSRRALEIRFQRTLGRSIRVEIQRVRLARTKQLLVETELPAWKVAEMAGFASLSYASKVFHRAVGVTLARYRRRHRAP
jgi:LacI family transcriptional regulator